MKKYVAPDMKTIIFGTADVIQTSGISQGMTIGAEPYSGFGNSGDEGVWTLP